MAEFTIHTIESAPGEAKEMLQAAEEQFGFVPNLLGELAAAPVALKAYMTLNSLLQDSSFSPVEQQLLLTSVSVANACTYCVAAHSAGLKQAGMADADIEAVRAGRPLSDAKLEALRSFTTTVVEGRGDIGNGDLDELLSAGYRREQVYEILMAVAQKTLSNYTNHIVQTPLDEQMEMFAWEPAGV